MLFNVSARVGRERSFSDNRWSSLGSGQGIFNSGSWGWMPASPDLIKSEKCKVKSYP